MTGDGVARFEGEKRVERVVTESGKTLDADLVVIGAGAIPTCIWPAAPGSSWGRAAA